MKRVIPVACFALITFASLGRAGAQPGAPSDEGAQPGAPSDEGACWPPCREGYICRESTGECVSPCNPPCRTGYICDFERKTCVSPCNPPCNAGETCTEEGECIPGTGTAAASKETKPEAGDRRFRLGFLGRFGFGGKAKAKNDLGAEDELDLDATLGYTLRFEKPPAKYVSVGLDLSNYWIRAKGNPERDLLTDISVLVKPRYPVVVGKKHRELEAYLNLQIGGTVAVFNSDNVYPWSTFGGGFNFNVAPGFQAFVASRTVLIFEVGYAYTWIRAGGEFTDRTYTLTVSQALLRVGVAGAF